MNAPDTHRASDALMRLCEAFCIACLEPILHTSQTLVSFGVARLIDVHKGVTQRSPRHLYGQQHPRMVLKALEDLRDRLRFERDVEGHIETLEWYTRQIALFEYADYIRECMAGIVNLVDHELVDVGKKFVDVQCTGPAAVWLHRAIEACHKADDQINALKELHEQLCGMKILDFEWHEHGAESLLGRIAKLRRETVHLMARLVPDLAVLPLDDRMPDFLGNTRAVLAEELVDLMDSKEEETFLEVFTAFFRSTLAIHERIREDACKPGKRDLLRVAEEMILDVLSLSGLAYLYEELDGTGYGRIVRNVWDNFLTQSQNPQAFVQWCYFVIDDKLRLPIFSSSAMMRQQWEQRFVASMVQRGVPVERDYFEERMTGQRHEPHRSAVIDSIHVHLGHMFRSLHGVFGALYLAETSWTEGLEIPRDVTEWIEAIRRTQERRQNDQPS